MGNAKIIPAKKVLFLPFQTKWIQDRSHKKIMEKSRQIGMTWASAYDLDREQSKKTTVLDAWVSSRDEVQARLFLEDCKNFAKLLKIGADDLGFEFMKEHETTVYKLGFSNGTRIHSMSSNPDAQAGKRGTRFIDEMALHREQKKLYDIAHHGTTWGGQTAMISTHRGTGSYFNTLIKEIVEKGNPKKISHHKVTLQDALEQGFLYKLQAKLPKDDFRQEMDEAAYFDYVKSQCSDEETFMQECMCVPADDDSVFIDYQLITRCEYQAGVRWEYSMEELAKCGRLYVGVDIGRTKDLTVISVAEEISGTLFVRKMIELENMPFSAQENILYPYLALPNMRRACIDASGIGKQFAERAGEKYGKYRAEPIVFTQPSKEDMAYLTRTRFEDATLRIPSSQTLAADIRGIRKITVGDNVRFDGERTKNGHSDRFWSLALMTLAAKPSNDEPAGLESARASTENYSDYSPFAKSFAEDGRRKDTLGGW